jgi:hypothetical protein
MGFEIIHEKKPSYSIGAMLAITFLAVVLLLIAVSFAYLLISGKGNDYILGTLLAFEFLIAAIEIVLFGRYFVAFREVSEDREEELLW